MAGKKRTTKGKARANGEGGLILRGKLWWCQYYQDGRQIRVSTKTGVRAEAVAFLRKLMDSRDKGEVPLSDVRRLKYADLRQALIDSYVAQGNKSLKERADGTESIAGLKALDDFCGFEQKTIDGKTVVTNRALQIEWSQVNLNSRTIRLEPEQTKTDEARTLPLPPSLVMMLAEIEPKTGRVFDGRISAKSGQRLVLLLASASSLRLKADRMTRYTRG